jgi:transposase-like protein
MGQVLHSNARTTQAIRAAIQRSSQSLQSLAQRHGINPKTVAKWRKRTTVADAPMGPKPASTVLTAEEEAIAVAFRRHTLLPLDDCLYARQATMPRRTRSALHRLFQRHGIRRLPLTEEGKSPAKKKFKHYPVG